MIRINDQHKLKFMRDCVCICFLFNSLPFRSPSSMSSGRGDNRDGVNRPISKHAKGSSVSKSTVGGEIAQSQTVKNLVSSSHERRREFG